MPVESFPKTCQFVLLSLMLHDSIGRFIIMDKGISVLISVFSAFTVISILPLNLNKLRINCDVFSESALYRLTLIC